MKLKIIKLCVFLSLATSLSSCGNTADGFGRDLERAGQTIQKKV